MQYMYRAHAMILIIHCFYCDMCVITCNVVSSQTNGPVPGMPVILRCISHPSPERNFTARTTARGHIMPWRREAKTAYRTPQGLRAVTGTQKTVWKIWFDIRGYYGSENIPLPMLSTVFGLMSDERCNIQLGLGGSTFNILYTWTRTSATQALLPVVVGLTGTREIGYTVTQNWENTEEESDMHRIHCKLIHISPANGHMVLH